LPDRRTGSYITIVTTRPRLTVVLAAISLAAFTACSGGDEPATSLSELGADDVGTGTDMNPDFDSGTLPSDFPSQLVPDSYSAGMYGEIGTVRTVGFEVASSFDDVVADYTQRAGEAPTVVEGEQRLAQWTVEKWLVAVFEDDPTLVTFTSTG